MNLIRIIASLALTTLTVFTPVNAECESRAADIIFIVDGSSSIYPLDFTKVINFIRDTVQNFEISPTTTRVGLVTFSNYARLRFSPVSFTNKRDLLDHGLAYVRQPTGDTRTDLALERARSLFSWYGRDGIPKIAIVVTDGGSDFPLQTLKQARLAHKEGIIMFAVGIGNKVSQHELEAIASQDSYVHNVDNFDGLSTIQGLLARQACTAEYFDPLEITSQPAFDSIEECDSKPTDLMFVLDGSDHVSRLEFYYQMEFVHDILGKFNISRRSVRVSVITYGTQSSTHIQFHNHQQRFPLQRALFRILQRKGSVNTHLALRRMREEFSRRSNSNREKLAIVISSGPSQDAEATREEATLAKLEGIKLFAIGFAPENPDLANIASEPVENYEITLPGYTSLTSLKSLFAVKACKVIEVEPTTTTSTTTTTTTTTTPAPTTTTTTPVPTTTTTTPAPSTTTTSTTSTTASRGFVPEAEMMLGDQAAACDRPVDVVFSLPSDLGTTDTAHVLNFIRSLTFSLNISQGAVNMGLVPKDCYASPGFELNVGQDASSLREKLDVNHFKKTNMASEIRRIRQDSFRASGRDHARRVAVLVVDRPSYDVVETEYEATSAKTSEQIEMFVIAVGDDVPEVELNTISSYPSSTHVLRVDEFCDLLTLNMQLAERLCP